MVKEKGIMKQQPKTNTTSIEEEIREWLKKQWVEAKEKEKL